MRALAALCLTVLGCSGAVAAPGFRAVTINVHAPGAGCLLTPVGTSNAGVIYGNAYGCTAQYPGQAAFSYTIGAKRPLLVFGVPGTGLPVTYTEIFDVSESGTYVGEYHDSQGNHPFTATGNTVTYPPVLGGFEFVNGLSSNGVYATGSFVPGNSVYPCGLVDGAGKMVSICTAQLAGLPDPGTGQVRIVGASNAGLAVGVYQMGPSGASRLGAFTYDFANGHVAELPAQSTSMTATCGINGISADGRAVLGGCMDGLETSGSILIKGHWVKLGPPGNQRSVPFAINSAGDVFGYTLPYTGAPASLWRSAGWPDAGQPVEIIRTFAGGITAVPGGAGLQGSVLSVGQVSADDVITGYIGFRKSLTRVSGFFEPVRH